MIKTASDTPRMQTKLSSRKGPQGVFVQPFAGEVRNFEIGHIFACETRFDSPGLA